MHIICFKAKERCARERDVIQGRNTAAGYNVGGNEKYRFGKFPLNGKVCWFETKLILEEIFRKKKCWECKLRITSVVVDYYDVSNL
jgi:hypothetical protein